MKLFVGADHAGFALKMAVREHLHHAGHEVVDVGARSLDEEDDYPKYAYLLTSQLLGEDNACGILICGSGQGMAIAANRIGGIRAGLAWDAASAESAKADDDCNVLVLPARFVTEYAALEMVDTWLGTGFKADPKYRRRLDELNDLYG